MPTLRHRTILFGLISVCGAVSILLLALELVLRLFPVEMSPRTVALDTQNPILRAPINTRFSHSVGWNFKYPNAGRTNNDGFFNEQDYHRDGTRPLLAVVGDSYVEAKMVPYAETIHGRLAADLVGSGRVYSFAMSGAPLSQYLAWISYARETYVPDAFIIVVVGNDFDESHVEYGTRTGFYHYYDNKDGSLQLRMTEYTPSFGRILILKSALARYLAFHLRIEEVWARLKTKADSLTGAVSQPQTSRSAPTPGPRYVGNTLATAGGDRQRVSIAVVDTFLRDIPEHAGLPPERILLLVDGLRQSIYAPNSAARTQVSYFAVMRRYFLEQAVERGYPVIDLHDVFEADYRSRKRRFEFDADAHWNGYGHKVIARAILQSRWYAAIRNYK